MKGFRKPWIKTEKVVVTTSQTVLVSLSKEKVMSSVNTTHSHQP